MIRIYLNGKEINIEKNQTINDLLDSQGLKEKMIAVAINMKIILKSEYNKTIIVDGDKIEIVRPVGGG